MKELTALDLFYLVKELGYLEGAKVDQIYQPDDVLIRLHVSGKGKQLIRITKKFIFLTDFKEEQPQPKGFCMALRKWLSGARVRKITQVGFERIACIELEKQEKFLLFIELFGKGNIVLTNSENKVLAALLYVGDDYTPPTRGALPTKISEVEFKQIMNQEKKAVLILAKDIGLGGTYAEYVLEKFDKDSLGSTLSKTDVKELYKAVKNLFTSKVNPSIKGVHISPLPIGTPIEETSYVEALSNHLSKKVQETVKDASLVAFEKKKDKLDNIIKAQEETVEKLKESAIKNTQKAEAIYANYQKVKDLLESTKKQPGKKSSSLVVDLQ